jgi:hypothetical protein
VLIAASLVWLAIISTGGTWNPFLSGSLFLFFLFIFFGIHFTESRVALSIKFWDRHPKFEAFFIFLGSLFAFASAYEAWTGIELYHDNRRSSIAIYYANLIGKIPIAALFMGLGFLMFYLCYLRFQDK